ncbi:MAG: carboxypeptidase-like regulatory domain-containing protein [Bacteroidales bacterium]|nr:carboxypeptidase-like regulatory domain-containing protein [Bacteroidales bacterium]
MRTLRIFLIAVLCLLQLIAPVSLPAQITKVRGKVLDRSTGNGVPFATVCFKGSTAAVSSDVDGWFAIETRIDTLTTLSVSRMGYSRVETVVTPGRFNTVYLALEPIVDELNPAIVKSDSKLVKRILGDTRKAKGRNNPESRDHYDCGIYSRNELDFVNPRNPVVRRFLPKGFHFVYDYVDTSLVSGQPYLPVMLSESKSHYYHSKSPEIKKEVIESSRISGFEEEKTVAQFTGGLYIKANFYENYINVFRVEIPSPLADNGSLFYDYSLIDSLYLDGRKTYRLRFSPSRWVSSPAFDGEMSIDAEDSAIRSVRARLNGRAGVNLVRNLVLNVENQRLSDSTWFYKQDDFYIDMSLSVPGASAGLSFIARRHIYYSDPSFAESQILGILDSKSPVLMHNDVLKRDEGYWSSVRPYPLSEKERGVYEMVDSVKNVPLYKGAEKVVDMFSTGFFNFKYLGLGPYNSVYSFNGLEGPRFQMGFRTTKDLSKRFRLMGYGAYGLEDRAWKGGVSTEIMFGNMPYRKLNLTYKRDMLPLGANSFGFGNGDVVNSLLTKEGGRKISMINDLAITYQHEWSHGFNMAMGLERREIFPSRVVPMVRPDGSSPGSVNIDQALMQLRFSKDEIITRGVFDRHFVFSSYPVVTLNMTAAMKGLGRNEYTFFRPEMRVQYTLLTPPAGSSSIVLNAGTVVGKVPYPLLKIYEGNETYRIKRKAFSCMDYYEFASDTWATLFWEHDFRGIFLGKIPLVKKLKLREVVLVRAAYGSLRDENNGVLGDPLFDSDIIFPEGMSKLETPYVEAGVGLANIFKVLRVDAVWRLTHRDTMRGGEMVPHPNRFVVNLGFEFNL